MRRRWWRHSPSDSTPQDNHEELMEIVELQNLLKDAEVERVTEVGWLAILVRDVSNVLVDLSMPPISGISWGPFMIDDILEAVCIILESMREAYALVFCFSHFISRM
jgi:hypothetical protein